MLSVLFFLVLCLLFSLSFFLVSESFSSRNLCAALKFHLFRFDTCKWKEKSYSLFFSLNHRKSNEMKELAVSRECGEVRNGKKLIPFVHWRFDDIFRAVCVHNRLFWELLMNVRFEKAMHDSSSISFVGEEKSHNFYFHTLRLGAQRWANKFSLIFNSINLRISPSSMRMCSVCFPFSTSQIGWNGNEWHSWISWFSLLIFVSFVVFNRQFRHDQSKTVINFD